MNEKTQFEDQMRKAWEICGKNVSQTAYKTGFSKSFVSNVINGKGPDEPKSSSWKKLETFLASKKALVVKEQRPDYGSETFTDDEVFIFKRAKERPEVMQALKVLLGMGG